MDASPNNLRDDDLVRDNPEWHRYEIYAGSEIAGVADYHTPFVPAFLLQHPEYADLAWTP